jgi:hypothetical protein
MFDWLKKLLLNKYAAVALGAALGYIGRFAESIGVPPEVVGQFIQTANAVLGAILFYFLGKGFDLTKKLSDKKKEDPTDSAGA